MPRGETNHFVTSHIKEHVGASLTLDKRKDTSEIKNIIPVFNYQMKGDLIRFEMLSVGTRAVFEQQLDVTNG
jgi:hypothetical protein